MSVWSAYEARFSNGDPDMDRSWNAAKDHIRSRMHRKIISSLSYKQVKFNGEAMRLAIIDSANDFSTKKIFAMPGEELPHGSVIEWESSPWLITEVNPHKELCAEGKMRRCNYYLKWINGSGHIIGRWSIVEDGTKYLIGERSEDIMAVGDARMAVTVRKDAETSCISRGTRFLIDDMESQEVMAYEVTKPNKLYNVFNGKGVFRFIMGESALTDNDNVALRIADYYNWKPGSKPDKPAIQENTSFAQIVQDAKAHKDGPPPVVNGKEVWL